MTNLEIFVAVLAHASGQPPAEIRRLCRAVLSHYPVNHRFFDRRPRREARELIAALKKDAPAVRRWLAKGADEVLAQLPSSSSFH